jgi:CheY-like chemotaxis protein
LHNSLTHVPAPESKQSPRSFSILCIDDERLGLDIGKRVLASAGYRVLTARSGEEGIRLFQSESFDAVVLDYWMPSLNGIATAHRLKRINPPVPLIILSGLSQLV